MNLDHTIRKNVKMQYSTLLVGCWAAFSHESFCTEHNSWWARIAWMTRSYCCLSSVVIILCMASERWEIRSHQGQKHFTTLTTFKFISPSFVCDRFLTFLCLIYTARFLPRANVSFFLQSLSWWATMSCNLQKNLGCSQHEWSWISWKKWRESREKLMNYTQNSQNTKVLIISSEFYSDSQCLSFVLYADVVSNFKSNS